MLGTFLLSQIEPRISTNFKGFSASTESIMRLGAPAYVWLHIRQRIHEPTRTYFVCQEDVPHACRHSSGVSSFPSSLESAALPTLIN